MSQKTVNPWTFDTRVRERNLKSGALSDKDVEKYLGQLQDVGDQAEPFATSQPALNEPDGDEGEVDERVENGDGAVA
jgi:hypothetical protein